MRKHGQVTFHPVMAFSIFPPGGAVLDSGGASGTGVGNLQ